MTPDDYLWDPKGPPDPEVQRLERTLSTLAHKDDAWAPPAEAVPAPSLPTLHPAADSGRRSTPRSGVRPRIPVWGWAAAAALAAVATIAWWRAVPAPAWEVTEVTGTPRVENRALAARARWRPGTWLVTDAHSRALLKVAELGYVDLAPGSRAQLLAAGREGHRVALAVGSLQAIIVAPPRRFAVETPAAHAVDLGCAYTIDVSQAGETVLTVDAGWVSFETEGRESFVPAGARAVTRLGRPPGTPYFTDAPFALKNALAELDATTPAGADSAGGRNAALSAALTAARPEDALTLWHLLARTEDLERSLVFDALAARVPAPEGVTREGILAGDAAMLDRWWDALGFGDTDDWRRWRRPWGEIAARGAPREVGSGGLAAQAR